MEVEISKEIFNSVNKKFASFLSNSTNERIIFSGKFGSGKTTFLKHFFEEESKERISYEVFRISPVSYSISVNEDIIEYIKYDLITELLVKTHIEILTADIPTYYFLSDKDIATIFRSILNVINTKGIDFKNILAASKKLKEHLEERKRSVDEGDKFVEFLETIEGRSGLFERDIITKTIETIFKRISNSSTSITLVVDDLDRVDPEHVFRILNVFSAHIDEDIYSKRGLKNKFGFDKIIFVCDYSNIESLFHNRFGKEADFNGYINKLYSRSIFDFNVQQEVVNYFKNLLFKMDKNVVQRHSASFDYFGTKQGDLLAQTIISSINFGFLTIRTLNKLIGENLSSVYTDLHDSLVRCVRLDEERYTLFLLRLNLFLFGSLKNLNQTFQRLFDRNINLKLDPPLNYIFYYFETSIRHNFSVKDPLIEFSTPEGTFCITTQDLETIIYPKGNKGVGLTNNQCLSILQYFVNRMKEVSKSN